MYYDNTVIMGEVDVLFNEYAMHIKTKTLKDLRGRIKFQDDYNYKSMRERV